MNKPQKVRIGIPRRASGSPDDPANPLFVNSAYHQSQARRRQRAKLKAAANGHVPYDPGKGPYECAYS